MTGWSLYMTGVCMILVQPLTYFLIHCLLHTPHPRSTVLSFINYIVTHFSVLKASPSPTHPYGIPPLLFSLCVGLSSPHFVGVLIGCLVSVVTVLIVWQERKHEDALIKLNE